jgi:alkylhydroperoxidase family enzyme
VATDWRGAELTEVDQALCAYAELITFHERHAREGDLDGLRAVGLDDRAIHDATQVIAYFNYITRIADPLGIEPEAFIQPWGAGPHPPSHE